MKILTEKRCVIGEGPIWNDTTQTLYFTNGFRRELCAYHFPTETLTTRRLPFSVSALAFDTKNRMIVSHANGVHILNDDDTLSPLYDEQQYSIRYANDMKVGPDGAIYVGTISEKFRGVSDKMNGKLYRISPNGTVEMLLDGMGLPNGFDWSLDETKLYFSDTDTFLIKEFHFDKNTGKIQFSGRQVCVDGVDGLTVGQDNCLYISCSWKKYVAVVSCETLAVQSYFSPPDTFPMSCGFCGKDMEFLAITTASDTADVTKDPNAGFTFLTRMKTNGRKPYLFKNLS